MENENGIIDFPTLKSFIFEHGIDLKDTANTHIEVIGDVEFKDGVPSNVEIKDGAFFDKEGHQVYLYKRDYNLERFPDGPKAHLCNCKTIQEFIERGQFTQHYRYANTLKIKVKNTGLEPAVEVDFENIPICKYCLKELRDKYGPLVKVDDFIKYQEEHDGRKRGEEVEVRNDGYIRDWEVLSRAYREERNYTCEKCGLKIDNPFDQRFMHVHHKNGDKKNNDKSNLQCLCIRCHSKVNEVHRNNFSKGSNKKDLEEFNEKY